MIRQPWLSRMLRTEALSLNLRISHAFATPVLSPNAKKPQRNVRFSEASSRSIAIKNHLISISMSSNELSWSGTSSASRTGRLLSRNWRICLCGRIRVAPTVRSSMGYCEGTWKFTSRTAKCRVAQYSPQRRPQPSRRRATGLGGRPSVFILAERSRAP